MKTISIFGSTGSIGKNTVEIIKNNLDEFEVIALVAGSGYKTLARQAEILKPKYVVLEDASQYQRLQDELRNSSVEILCGSESILAVAKIKCDIVVSAIMGFAGLLPTYEAIKAGSNIAIANKESIVCAGDLINKEAQKSGSKIYPVDSEHNAIFQIFDNDKVDKIETITLTASGGPFFNKDIDFSKVTPEMALKHPNWSMGAKISIDSATMMNKGLELIEAYYLFTLGQEKIDVLVHPQSIVHGMVHYVDGNSLAVMSLPDMKIPISYCLSMTNRMAIEKKPFDLAKVGRLDFFDVDDKKYPAINLCKEALKEGAASLIALNAANEIAVAKFLKGDIRFDEITKFVAKAVEKVGNIAVKSIEDVVAIDKKIREWA
ncbi:MAG: 1-deoxy-D-xylulose-5-phosphate reductoisomerase [Rickettsiales bacterium]|nr:1-deoxy-D-xylulose-5-phosphate reductoisomerase [Rickettsiales bacterium]